MSCVCEWEGFLPIQKNEEKWEEDLILYRNHGFSPYWTLICKIISKVPQFVSAKFIKKK